LGSGYTNTQTHQPTQKIFPYIRSLQIFLVCKVSYTYSNNPQRRFSHTLDLCNSKSAKFWIHTPTTHTENFPIHHLISSTILSLQNFGYIYQTNYTDFSPHFSSDTSSGCRNSKSTRLWIQVYTTTQTRNLSIHQSIADSHCRQLQCKELDVSLVCPHDICPQSLSSSDGW